MSWDRNLAAINSWLPVPGGVIERIVEALAPEEVRLFLHLSEQRRTLAS
jgi:hypothetical protein